MDALTPRPASYYYKRCFILGLILQPWFSPRQLLPAPLRNFLQKRSKKRADGADDDATKKKLLFAYARFLVVLSAWLVVLYVACDQNEILRTVHRDGQKIVGLLNDGVNYGICFWMIFGMALLLWILRKLDAVLLNFLNIVDCSKDPDEPGRLRAEVEHARQFISINTRGARQLYGVLTSVGTLLVLWYAFAKAVLDRNNAHSWALEPFEFPGVFVIAQPWAFFWTVVVFANFIWFIFCIIYFVFWRVSVYASRKKIIVPPISVDERGGLRSIGELAFMIMILSSGGVLVAVGWHIIFEELDTDVRFVINLYVIVLALLYTLPIWYLKTALKHSRELHLAAWFPIFAAAYATVVTFHDGNKPDPKTIKTNRPFEQIASITHIYARVEKMPRSPVGMFMNVFTTVYLSVPSFVAFNLAKIGGWLGGFFGAR